MRASEVQAVLDYLMREGWLHQAPSAERVVEALTPPVPPREPLSDEAREIGRQEGCSECVQNFHPDGQGPRVTSQNPKCPIRGERCVRYAEETI